MSTAAAVGRIRGWIRLACCRRKGKACRKGRHAAREGMSKEEACRKGRYAVREGMPQEKAYHKGRQVNEQNNSSYRK